MAGRRLPPPVSTTDEYLAAIHDRLGELVDALRPQPASTTSGPVKVREPAAKRRKPKE